jgi:tetratricopeptide (TPR) repeat protein
LSWSESLENARQALIACEWDLCSQWLERALEDCAHMEPNRRALTLNNLGLMFRRIGDWQQAIACYEQAMLAVQEDWLKGRIIANWAVLEHRQGRLNEARRRYSEALTICGADELAVARVCINFSWLHLQQERTVQAETLLKRARSLTQNHPEDPVMQSRLHLGAARLALHQKRLAKAEMEVLQGIRLAQKLDYFEPVLHAQARAALGNVYSLQAVEQLDQPTTQKDGEQRRGQAQVLFQESLMLLLDWGQKLSYEFVDAAALQVDHFIRLQMWNDAEIALQEALSVVTEMTGLDPQIRAGTWERAAKVLVQLGKHELAKRALKEFQAISLER